MDSLSSILGNKDFEEPPIISTIKKYILEEFNKSVGVKIQGENIIIIVSSSSLANSLRLKSPELKRRCHISGRISYQITKT